MLQPTSWVRVDLTPVSGTPIVWQASVRPYADPPGWQGGYKQGGIIEFGPARRSLSGRDGAPIVSEFSFVYFDRDGFWRGVQADPDTQYLTFQEVGYYLASVDAHTTLVDPRTLFRGQLQTPEPMPGRKYRISAKSRLGTAHGPYDLDAAMLKRGALRADWPNIDRDKEGACVPSLHGEQSDEGTTNIFGVDVSAGTVFPMAYGSPSVNAGTAMYLSTPPAPTYTIVGSPSGTTSWSFAVSVRTIYGGRTMLSPWTTVPNMPSSADGFDTSNYLVFSEAQYDVLLATHVFGAGGGIDLYVKKGTATSTAPVRYVDAAGNMFNTAPGTPFTGTDGFHINGDDAFTKTWNPPPTYSSAVIPATGTDVYTWFNLLRHTGSIISIRALKLVDPADETSGEDPPEEPVYELITVADVGTDVGSGKPFILGPDGTGITLTVNGRDYFGFYALTEDPRTKAHLENTMPFRVNLCGWPMDQAFCVYQDLFELYANGPNGMGHQSGPRLSIPYFTTPPIVPLIQSSRFAQMQQLSTAHVVNSEGYLVTVYVDTFDDTWRSVITDMDVTLLSDQGENHHGQVIVTIPDDTGTPTMIRLREFEHILRVENAGRVDDQAIRNIAKYQFDWSPISRDYRSGIIELRGSATSIAKYGERPIELNFRFTRDAATAASVAARTLAELQTGPADVTVVARLSPAMMIELGDMYEVQHSDLIVSTPITLYCVDHQVDVERGEVTITGRTRP